MNPSLKQYFTFTRSQRSGLLALLLLMVVIQCVYFCADTNPLPLKSDREWMSVQSQIDSMKLARRKYKPTIYPFNPNFITDFKGYKLGMSVAEIDRLLAFREQGRFVNSASEFQSVTKISDSLLAVISPHFKFPDWVNNKKQRYSFYPKNDAAKKFEPIDINVATQEDLMKIYGIGPAISERILKQRDLLGGFVDMLQVSDIWGLSPEVIEKLNSRYKIGSIANLRKIKINDASVKELSTFPYFRYSVAKQIVTYRSMNGNIANALELQKINGFPVERAEIIALYLDF